MRLLATFAAALLCVAWFSHAHAQVLQGRWVDDSQAAIDKHRKTDVTVIVLDREDRAVRGATVELTQVRHDFVIGLTLPTDRLPPEAMGELPVYRCINAIALDRLTDWSVLAESSERPPAEVAAKWKQAVDPIRVSFGRVVSADPARNDDKLSLLSPRDLRDAVLARIDLAADFKPAPDRYDLYADLLSQDMLERKLGTGMLHRVFEHARAKRTDAGLGLRVRNVIALQRARDLASAVQTLEIRQIAFDHITIEQRFTGQVQPLPLGRMLEQTLAPLRVPVSFAMLEVGGPTGIAAGLNMETLLRMAFAQPRIDGIYLAGVYDSELVEDHAALLTDANEPTAAGMALDQLFYNYWRSDVSAKTDERGNAEARVFTGWYVLSATLPSGQVITGKAYIPKDERTKLIVLQQTAAEDQTR